MNMLRDAAETHAADQRAFASEPVRYIRRNPGTGLAEAVVLAVIAAPKIDRKESRKIQVVRQERDFLIVHADLLAAFGLTEFHPQPGDRIEQEGGCGGRVFFEAAPRENEPCCRWSDEFNIRWRIHAQLVK